MALYQLTSTGSVIRTTDGATIPADPGNRDYQDHLAWVALGNVPDAPPAPLAPADTTFDRDPWQTLTSI